MNLQGLLSEAMSSLTIGQISQDLGADENTTAKAVRVALPILIGAMAENCATPDGASSLVGALDRDHNGSLLDDIGGFLSDFNSSDGLGILGHIFGQRLGIVQHGISQASRLDARRAEQLLATLAPLVMGAVGRVYRQDGLDANSLAGYLNRTSQQMMAESKKKIDLYYQKEGVNSSTVIARGYNGNNAVASNDTDEGRFMMRRLEYAVAK